MVHSTFPFHFTDLNEERASGAPPIITWPPLPIALLSFSSMCLWTRATTTTTFHWDDASCVESDSYWTCFQLRGSPVGRRRLTSVKPDIEKYLHDFLFLHVMSVISHPPLYCVLVLTGIIRMLKNHGTCGCPEVSI